MKLRRKDRLFLSGAVTFRPYAERSITEHRVEVSEDPEFYGLSISESENHEETTRRDYI